MKDATSAIVALLMGMMAGSADAATPRPAPAEVTVIAGGYEISNGDGTRKCLVVLRPASVPGGHAIGFPPQCRVALPVMAGAAAWSIEPIAEAPHARIRLHTTTGAILLDFSRPGADGTAVAKDATNATYGLKPGAGATLEQRMAALRAKKDSAPKTAALAAASSPIDPIAMQRASGTYALLRERGKDSGCTLLLTASTHQGAARLGENCLDAGLRTFAPTGWTISEGTLWLIGGKAQRLSFEKNRRDGWDKAPGQGAPLSLVREPR